ncbi:MAG: hypothetical protein ABIR11_01610 [Candidatus Limnocylindrales bacterium]
MRKEPANRKIVTFVETQVPVRVRRLVVLWAVTAIVASCSGDVIVGGGAFSTHANGVRTYQQVTSINGAPLGCAMVDVDLVRGTVRSGAGRAVDSVWLNDAGSDIHVIWPDVWTFAFDANGVHITNERGRLVAAEGDEVVLRDRRPDEATGTMGDPYVAWGRVQARGDEIGCYAYLR